MKENKLEKAISGIDDGFIEDAILPDDAVFGTAAGKRRRFLPSWVGVAAACLVVGVTVYVGLILLSGRPGKNPAVTPAGTVAPVSDVPVLRETEPVDDSDVHGELIPYTVSCNTPLISTDDLFITVLTTSKVPGETIYRSDKWTLISVNGQKKTEIGTVGYEVALEMEPRDETDFAQRESVLCFSAFVSAGGGSSATLAPGRYCIDHLNERDVTVARIYFEVKSPSDGSVSDDQTGIPDEIIGTGVEDTD